MIERVDVLVVGGGPAGLATARAAAGSANVLLVHRDRDIGRPVRTSGGSWLRDMVKLGIPEKLYNPISSLVFAGPTRWASVRFGTDRPVVLDVTGTYLHLAGLAEEGGVRIDRSTTFAGVESVGDDEVVCVLSNADGQRSVAARFVVDASGHKRSVMASIGKAPRAMRFGVGAEIEFENLADDQSATTLFVGQRFAPSGYGWIFPTTRGTVRVGVGVIRPDTSAIPTVLLDSFLSSTAADDLGVRLGKPIERHSGIIPSDGPVATLVQGRFIAVGDAAGQALPIVGEGIRFCIEAGLHAGNALKSALGEPAKEAEWLSQYSNWWQRAHGARFALAQGLNERISAYNDDKWDEKIQLLSLLDGDTMAAFLRLELSPAQVARVVVRHPVPTVQYAFRRLRRKLAHR